ncbi:hypothetical protein C475_03754 [Halosimplex carlsbadense 2-9-1]|uniref:Uncharacterized protein n=1 Tax=Halosimplex carlsbadense 2-9-1 TaxID=797114 RepID=M0D1A9_9EURY|nr:hypothetical protein [Halosimplex carlsbadense]ELZ29301.1 hypothetical protein C475_03754 [Halosimplex carlsbadense 2-9-1]
MVTGESDTESGPVDVLRYETDDAPVYRAAPAGEGEAIVAAHERERRKRRVGRLLAAGLVALGIAAYGVLSDSLALAAAGVALVAVAFAVGGDDAEEAVPELVERNQFRRDAERAYDLEE